MHEWQVWLVAALLLFVAEMIAPGFWLLSVAVGCLTAGVVSLVVPGAAGLCAIPAGGGGLPIGHHAPGMPTGRGGKHRPAVATAVNLIIPVFDKRRAIDWHQVFAPPAGAPFARHFRTDKIDLR